MGIVAVKIKIMPSSPETNLEEIKSKVKGFLEGKGAKNLKFDEEPVAFGLKAIIAFFAWDESLELEPVEEELGKIENVNSIQIIDMRRAFG